MQNIGIRYYRPDGAEFEWNGFNQVPSLVQKLPPNFYKNMIPRQNVAISLVASTPKRGTCVVDSSMALSAIERNRDLNYLTNGYVFDGGEPGVREFYYFTPTLKPRTNGEESQSGPYCTEVSQTRENQMPSQSEGQAFFNRSHTDIVQATYPLPSNPRPESGMATINSIERNILKMREAMDGEYSLRDDDEPTYWMEQERNITDKFSAPYRPIYERKPRRSCTHESPKRSKERSFDWGDENSDYEEYRETSTLHGTQKSSLHRFSEEQLYRLEKRKKALSLKLEKKLEKIKRDLSRSPNRVLKRFSDKSLDIGKKYIVKAIGYPTSYDENTYGIDERDKKHNMRKQTGAESIEKSYRELSKKKKRRTTLKRLNAIKRDMAVECLAVLLATPEEMDLMTSEDDLDNDSWDDFENLSKSPKEQLENISEPVYHTESSNSNELSSDIDYSYGNETRGRNHNMNRSYARKNMYYDTLDEMDDGHKCQIRNVSQSRGTYKEYQDVSPQLVRNDFMELYNTNRYIPEE